jgi:hypothetical protein
MAIPSDTCALCCTCPTATVEWDSRSASRTQYGYEDGAGFYTTKVLNETYSGSTSSSAGTATNGCPGALNANSAADTGLVTNNCTLSMSGETCAGWTGTVTETLFYGSYGGDCGPTDCGFALQVDTVNTYTWTTPGASGTVRSVQDTDWKPCAGLPDTHTDTTTATDPYTAFVAATGSPTSTTTYDGFITFPDLYALAYADLPAYDSSWTDTAGSYRNQESTSSTRTISIRESRYRLRFKIPTIINGINFRATWAERFIGESGTSISSVEVLSGGIYRPIVTLSAPPSGGTQAYAVAIMSSTGTIASISILDPGTLYASAPTVTVQTASGGGTTSTGWTATLTAGSVTAIVGGTAGNYRPTLAFSGGGGSSATATCTVNAQGGIDVVTMTASGTAYTSEPTLTITPKVSGSTAADLLIHLGTETSKCTVWDGTTPGGYDPATSSTWPILPSAAPNYYSLAVPATDGTTLVANVRTYCDGSTC